MEKLQRLEEKRKERDLTRSELAKLSGVSPATIQRLEVGLYNVNMVKLGTLIALSKALHCKVVDILDKDLKKVIY